MTQPPHKLDYADQKGRPAHWWNRIPQWLEVLIVIGAIYLVAILFGVLMRRGGD